MKRIRPGTVLLLALILVLGYSLVIRQRREARLRAVLALYKGRAQRDVQHIMGKYHHLNWPDETPLSEVIEQIKQATNRWLSLFPKGVPIYVDPDGLREAGQSLSSPVAAPPDDSHSQQRPLRQELRMILEPLGLACDVKDGAIVITSRQRVVDESPASAAADDEE
jgi:hypothetical protein